MSFLRPISMFFAESHLTPGRAREKIFKDLDLTLLRGEPALSSTHTSPYFAIFPFKHILIETLSETVLTQFSGFRYECITKVGRAFEQNFRPGFGSTEFEPSRSIDACSS